MQPGESAWGPYQDGQPRVALPGCAFHPPPVTAVLRLGRALAALALTLGLVAPGLDACMCDLFSDRAQPCCDEARASRADAGQAQLDDGPCCCCALDVTAAPAPAPTVAQRESKVDADAPWTALGSAASFASIDAANRGGSGLRPAPGPDPSPPFARLHRRTVVLLI